MDQQRPPALFRSSQVALHLQDTTPRALQPVTCHVVRTPTMQAYTVMLLLPASLSHMTQACSTRQKGAETSSGRRWAAMEMLSMLKAGYTILRSETPATDLVNTFMDWAARRSLVLLAIFLPPYYIYKLTTSAFAAAVPEDVAGKVVLITGASSGIGEVWQPVRSLLYAYFW